MRDKPTATTILIIIVTLLSLNGLDSNSELSTEKCRGTNIDARVVIHKMTHCRITSSTLATGTGACNIAKYVNTIVNNEQSDSIKIPKMRPLPNSSTTEKSPEFESEKNINKPSKKRMTEIV